MERGALPHNRMRRWRIARIGAPHPLPLGTRRIADPRRLRQAQRDALDLRRGFHRCASASTAARRTCRQRVWPAEPGLFVIVRCNARRLGEVETANDAEAFRDVLLDARHFIIANRSDNPRVKRFVEIGHRPGVVRMSLVRHAPRNASKARARERPVAQSRRQAGLSKSANLLSVPRVFAGSGGST